MIRRDLKADMSTLYLATVVGVLACAPVSETPAPGQGHGGSTGMMSSGGAVGVSGSPSFGGFIASGGFTSTSGGATASGGKGGGTSGGGASNTASGGTTAAGGTATATSGGTTAASGGATTTTSGGAATTASGGSSSGCTAYAGTVKTDSTIFMNGFGKATTTFQGYAYGYTYGDATIKPSSTSASNSCFMGAQLCVQGSVPADYDSGAGIGWNINQTQGSSTADSLPLTGSITFKLAGAKAGMRVALGPVSGDEFCYTLTSPDATAAATGLTLTVDQFAQACYDTATAVPYADAPIKSIQVSVPGSEEGVQTFDFCIVDIEPG